MKGCRPEKVGNRRKNPGEKRGGGRKKNQKEKVTQKPRAWARKKTKGRPIWQKMGIEGAAKKKMGLVGGNIPTQKRRGGVVGKEDNQRSGGCGGALGLIPKRTTRNQNIRGGESVFGQAMREKGSKKENTVA